MENTQGCENMFGSVSYSQAAYITGITGNNAWSTVTVPNSYTYTNTSYAQASNMTSTKIKLDGADADIEINGISLGQQMKAIEKRLAILVPNPELLEKYEALQMAYDHYKTLEALLYEEAQESK